MSEAHDTEEEKCELPETDEMGGRNFFDQTTTNIRLQGAVKQASKEDVISLPCILYVCVCVFLDIVSHCFPPTRHCFLYLFM